MDLERLYRNWGVAGNLLKDRSASAIGESHCWCPLRLSEDVIRSPITTKRLTNAFQVQSPRLQTTTQQSARKFCLQSYRLQPAGFELSGVDVTENRFGCVDQRPGYWILGRCASGERA